MNDAGDRLHPQTPGGRETSGGLRSWRQAPIAVALAGAATAAIALGLATGVAFTPSARAPSAMRLAAAADLFDQLSPAQRERLLAALNGEAAWFDVRTEAPIGYRPVPDLLNRRAEDPALAGRDARVLLADPSLQYRPRLALSARLERATSLRLQDGRRLIVMPAPRRPPPNRSLVRTLLWISAGGGLATYGAAAWLCGRWFGRRHISQHFAIPR